MSENATFVRFDCTTGGAIAQGKNRLATLLLSLFFGMLALGIFVWFSDSVWFANRRMPALACLGAAFIAWLAWRMSGDLDVLWLDLDGEKIAIQMRRQRLQLPLLAPSARRLSKDERIHLERLASRAMITAGTGGYDSHLLGEFNLYASNLENAVLIDTGEAQVIVTPDKPDALASRFSK